MRCYTTVEVKYYKQVMKKWHCSLVSNFSTVNIFSIADNVTALFSNVTIMSYITIVTNVSLVNKKNVQSEKKKREKVILYYARNGYYEQDHLSDEFCTSVLIAASKPKPLCSS